MNKGCPKCGRMVAQTDDVCPYCGYKFAEIEKVYKMAINTEIKKVNENPGLIQRLTAFTLDVLIMMIIFMGLYFANPLDQYINFINVNVIYLAIVIVIYFLYCTILEATPLKGSFGTRILNLQVVDDAGYQISFSMAFKHNLFKILNIITLGIGYLALVFTKHKQTIADYFSDIYFENRNLEYNTKLYYANLFLRLFAFIIDVLFLAVIYFVITFILNYFIKIGFIHNLEQVNKIVNLVIAVIGLVYFTILDSRGGTFGKQLFSYEVANLNGEEISAIKSLFRNFFLIFEILLLPLGLLLCFVWPTKQTFKDLITKTVVIKKVYYK